LLQELDPQVHLLAVGQVPLGGQLGDVLPNDRGGQLRGAAGIGDLDQGGPRHRFERQRGEQPDRRQLARLVHGLGDLGCDLDVLEGLGRCAPLLLGRPELRLALDAVAG
jgi:hypothetical protein